MTLSKNYDVYIGIDVDKKSYSFTVYHNEMKKSKKIPSKAKQFYTYIKKNYAGKKVLCAYEAGRTGYHLYDYLTSKNCDCWVISPASIPKPGNARVKNNRIDSETITRHLQAENLTPIRVPIGVYRELRHLVRIREEYACKRKKARQRIKGLLLFANLYPYIKDPDNSWSHRYIKALKEIPCSKAVRIRLDMLLEDLNYARKQLLIIHRQIKDFVESHVDIQRNEKYLRSLPGIGPITATAILGRIGNPIHLKNSQEIGSFIGLTPKEKSTGERIRRGPITHLGDKYLRKLLIEAAWIAIGRDTELNQFFYRVMKRNHPKGAMQKAIVAVARKLTQRIYVVLKEQRMYIMH